MFGAIASLVGAAAGGAGKAAAGQRAGRQEMEMEREGLRQGGEQAYIDALFGREQERRASAGDAWKKLQQADFLAGGGTQTPGVSPYSKAVQGPSANMQAVASNPTFIDELVKRAHYADPLNPTNAGHTDMQLRRLAIPGSESTPNVYGQMDRNARPGTFEKIMGMLSMGGAGADAYQFYQGGGMAAAGKK